MHHDQAVAHGQCLLHVVRDHQRRQILRRDSISGQLGNQSSTLWVKSSGVLVKKQDARVREGRHRQRQSLTLATGQQTNLGSQTIFEALFERCQNVAEHGALLRCQSRPQGSAVAS